MGVHSVCISSTVTIPASQTALALAALKKGTRELGFFDSLNLELCHRLTEALQKLGFEFDVVDGDIRAIQFVMNTCERIEQALADYREGRLTV